MTDRRRRTEREPNEPLAPLPPDEERTVAEHEQAEWEKDRLVDLWAAWELRRPDSPFWTDPHLLEWQARELRARPTDPGEAEAARRMRERVLRRLAAMRAPVLRVESWPTTEPVQTPALVREFVEEGRAARRAPVSDLAIAAGVGRELWDEACAEWVEVPGELPSGRYVALRVAGDSMTPLLHDGDLVLVQLGGAEPKPGAIVVARRPETGYVVKQVGRLGRAAVELVSMNPEYAPVFVPRDERTILGTVVLRWCGHDEPARRRM